VARAAVLMIALVLAGCGGQGRKDVTVHLRGSSTNARSAGPCLLVIRQHVSGGGTSTYCLERFSGRPAPHATVRDSGVMTFRLPVETIRAHVRIVVKFAADGRHAVQKLNGTIAGGRRITGGGSYVEDPPGHVAASDLRYTIRFAA
jgi:hypothetical protein